MTHGPESIQTRDKGRVTESIPGTMTEDGREVDVGASGTQGQLPDFPESVEAEGA